MRQLVQDHKLCFELVLWPELRDNLIMHGCNYDLQEVSGLISCTFRMRGAFSREFVTRENDGDMQIKQDFYDQFMDISNWGLLATFWKQYPQSTEGMEARALLREEHLIPPL